MSYTQNLAVQNADGSDNIRLLRILNSPSERRQRMRCEVQMFSLQQAPRYLALSYCWRTDDESRSVEFQGSLQGIRSISRDLGFALWIVQAWSKNDWLWVDAICVDQSEVAEKNDQVPRMQMIYEGAHDVVVWLGEAVPRREGDFPEYKSYSDYDSKEIDWRYPVHVVDFRQNEDLGLTRGKVMELCDLSYTGRVWWSRIWIIQEMVVPANLYVCTGSRVIRWNEFANAMDFLWAYDRDIELLLRHEAIKVSRLNDLRECWQKNKYSLSMLELFDIGRRSHATDPKDNIYGLLGLMRPEDKRRICVDYNRSTNLVYAEVTAMLIEEQRSLDFLVFCFTYRDSHSQPSLPSWVIDFGGCQENTSWGDWLPDYSTRARGSNEYQASANTTPSICFDASSLKLQLQAVLFDNIVATTITRDTKKDSFDDLSDGRSDTENILYARKWLLSATALSDAAFRKGIPPSDPRSGLSRKNDTISNLLYPGRGIRPWLELIFSVEIDCQYDDSGIGWLTQYYGEHEDFRETILETSERFVLFMTASGFAGFASYDQRSRGKFDLPDRTHSACPGDVIVIPLGSSRPWILRETEVKGEYRLLIDCIVPAIMSGEVMRLVEAGQMETEWITLV